jgi:hypothetical protein
MESSLFWGARGFRLTLWRYFRDSLPPWMSPFLQSQARASGDAALLRIVMENLLQNAWMLMRGRRLRLQEARQQTRYLRKLVRPLMQNPSCPPARTLPQPPMTLPPGGLFTDIEIVGTSGALRSTCWKNASACRESRTTSTDPRRNAAYSSVRNLSSSS